MRKAVLFTFGNYFFDPATGVITSEYVVEFDTGVYETYSNRIYLNDPRLFEKWEKLSTTIQRNLLQSLHLAFGVVYWKMHCAPKIEIKNFSLNAFQKKFWDTFYTKGLGEFFYVNKIDYRGLVDFPADSVTLKSVNLACEHSALVGIGGGKDSLVVVELLRELSIPLAGFTLNRAKVQELAISESGIESFNVSWRVDHKIFEEYGKEEIYYGHVPYSGLYSFVGVLLTTLVGCRYVAFGNERSANVGNLEYLGHEINHQWSKSEEFEVLFREYVNKCISPDIVPFSVVRSFSELAITRMFVQFPSYFKSFSSCNVNFTSNFSNESNDSPYWCGKCPKCLFVFTCLSAYLSKDVLVSIFGKNLYEDESLIFLMENLLGISGHKPFECVGTEEETLVALTIAHGNGYHDSPLIKYFSSYIYSKKDQMDSLKTSIFESHHPKHWPQELPKLNTNFLTQSL